MSRYTEKMAMAVEQSPSHEPQDYTQYINAMDAICSRKPERMNECGIVMLRAKVGQIMSYELRSSAEMALEELMADVRETHPTTPANEAV